MKNIFEVLQEKEDQLREKKQAVKVLEEQVAKLRGAIEIFKEVMKGEETASPVNGSNVLTVNGGSVLTAIDDPLNLNTRPAPQAAVPTRNWP
jgi:hypothetical protein